MYGNEVQQLIFYLVKFLRKIREIDLKVGGGKNTREKKNGIYVYYELFYSYVYGLYEGITYSISKLGFQSCSFIIKRAFEDTNIEKD